MKNRLAMVFLLGLFVCAALAAQTNDRNISLFAGTWIDDENVNWVVNSNGTISRSGRTLTYGITDTQMVIVGWGGGDGNFRIYDYTISSDGKTIIMMQLFPTSSKNAFWLKKQ